MTAAASVPHAQPRTLVVPLEKATQNYGAAVNRWRSPDCITLRGGFRHNHYSPFRVEVFETNTEFLLWHGEANVPKRLKRHDVRGELSAQPSVIAASYGPKDYRAELVVGVGDILITYLGRFEIHDDWELHDPYLVQVPRPADSRGAFV
jgi:hypothetical protein